MKPYQRSRAEKERNAVIVGLLLTIGLHLGALALVSFTGIKYLWPPPQESTLLISFEDDFEPEFEITYGREPEGEDVDKDAPIEIVQRSESPFESTAQNLTAAAKADDFGDVNVLEPEQPEEPKLDPRASFPGMSAKDSATTPHSAEEASATYRAGQAHGNTKEGSAEGVPNAHLKGRKVNKSTLFKPAYNLQESGTVVVKIWVDQYGHVKRAEPGADGTTVTNAKLWAAARAVALKAHFDMKTDAPPLQEGTITYIFTLK